MLQSTPQATRVISSEVPPLLMKGSGIPVVGRTLVTAAMLMKAWMQIQPTIPPASRAPKASGARIEARTPRQPSRKKAVMTARQPMSPSSSPMIAKMKSVWASGSHWNFWIELPSPTPRSPPLPSASSDCAFWNPVFSGSLKGSRNEWRRLER